MNGDVSVTPCARWPQRVYESSPSERRGGKHTRVLWAAFKRTELHFNLKQEDEAGDVGQPLTQGGKYPELKLKYVYRCTRQARILFYCFFLCIKVALINSCTSSLRHPARLVLLFPARLQSIFEPNYENITRQKTTMAWRGASLTIVAQWASKNSCD